MPPIKHDSNEDILRGQLMLFIEDSPIAFATSAGMNISTEAVDVSNKMMGDWKASLPGKKSFTLSSEALVSKKTGHMSFDTLLAKQIKGETMDFYFGSAAVSNETNVGGEFEIDTTKDGYMGTVMITSLDLKSDNGQITTCSASFEGVGALVPVAAVP